MTALRSRERPAAGARALMKTEPADFHVAELAGVTAEGAGEHLYLRIEKTGWTTADTAAWLAASYQVGESAVGYAGMKDKHAVTEQWFSVCTPRSAHELPSRDGVRVLESTRHRRKLRRGELAGNRFRVLLRDVRGGGWDEGLEALDAGVPNFFGPQRFGRDNLDRARAWLEARRSGRPDGRRRRSDRHRSFRAGLHLSVLRSFLFNEVLAARVAADTWRRILPGEAAVPLPRPGRAQDPESSVPSGPLWGRGRSPARAEALAVETRVLAAHAAVCHGLEHAGPTQQRRSLVLRPAGLCWEVDGRDVCISFTLPPGTYATTLLENVFDLVTPAGYS